jgi:hypothetical protein
MSAQSSRLMEHRAILALAHVESPEEMQTGVRGSLLFADAAPTASPLDEVTGRFERTVRDLAERSPDGRIADLFLLEKMWEDFRTFAKSILAETKGGRPVERGETVDVMAEVFHACWEGMPPDERLQPFADAAAAIREVVAGESEIPGVVDRIVDAQEAAALKRTAHALSRGALAEWVDLWMCLRAGLALFRARRLGWDVEEYLRTWQAVGVDDPALADLALGGEDEGPAAWDRLGLPNVAKALQVEDAPVALAREIDDRITDISDEARGVPFGPECAFAFFWALRNETKNLRLALTAAACGIDEERVAAELRR